MAARASREALTTGMFHLYDMRGLSFMPALTINSYPCRIEGVSVCVKTYVRLSFVRPETVGQLKFIVFKNEDYHPPPPPAPKPVQPNSHIQRLYVDVVSMIVTDLGEVMPHEFVRNPLDRNEKRERVYIPTGLASDVTDLTRMLFQKGLLPDTCTPGTLRYLAMDVFPKFFWYVFIKKWIPFAKCDKCVAYLNDLTQAASEEVRASNCIPAMALDTQSTSLECIVSQYELP